MKLKSFPTIHPPLFKESSRAPIHLAEYNGNHYYAFFDDVKPPRGGKAVSDEEQQQVIANSLLFRQVKDEARRRIEAIAPPWKQRNALMDWVLLIDKKELTDAEEAALNKAAGLFGRIQRLRDISNDIEVLLLNGINVNYLTDEVWEVDADEETIAETDEEAEMKEATAAGQTIKETETE